MKLSLKSILLPVAVLMLASCVGKKKFVASETGRLTAEEQVKAMIATIEMQNGKMAALETDTARLGKQIREFRAALSSNMTQQEKLNLMLKSQNETLSEQIGRAHV